MYTFDCGSSGSSVDKGQLSKTAAFTDDHDHVAVDENLDKRQNGGQMMAYDRWQDSAQWSGRIMSGTRRWKRDIEESPVNWTAD